MVRRAYASSGLRRGLEPQAVAEAAARDEPAGQRPALELAAQAVDVAAHLVGAQAGVAPRGVAQVLGVEEAVGVAEQDREQLPLAGAEAHPEAVVPAHLAPLGVEQHVADADRARHLQDRVRVAGSQRGLDRAGQVTGHERARQHLVGARGRSASRASSRSSASTITLAAAASWRRCAPAAARPAGRRTRRGARGGLQQLDPGRHVRLEAVELGGIQQRADAIA